jgi:hypothetical protein
MDAIDNIFLPYRGQTIEMDFFPGSTFAEIVSKLEDILGSDNVVGFMMGPVLDYTNKFDIKFVEPEDDIMVDPMDLQRRANQPKIPIGFDDEIIRMKYLAGLNESDEIKKKLKKDQVLTFNSEEDRDLALEWLEESNNYPNEVKKYAPSRLYYKPEDALSIMFPTDNNLNEGLDERKFEGIVEILHRAINKTIPNSRTIKVKDNG